MAREMKDSGIEWIGEIPSDYYVYRLKYLLRRPLDYGANSSGVEYSIHLPRYIRITDIAADGKLKKEGALSLGLEDARPYILEEGDILFARSGATVGKSFIYHTEYGRAAFAGYLIRAQLRGKIVPEYVYYYTCSTGYDIWKNGIFIQSTIQNIGADKYANLPIVLPDTKDEQMRIVSFLEYICMELDNVLEKTRASIEEYKKLKQAVITQAVTKGIRGNRKMKDSGIEWIGEIPAEWNLIKVTRLLDYSHSYPIGDGDHGLIKTDDYIDAGVPYIRVQNLGWGTELDCDNIVYISEERNQVIANSILKPNDILFAKTGATIGKTAIVPSSMLASNTSSHIGKMTVSSDYSPRFVFYVMSSYLVYRQFWEIAGLKSTRPELSIDEIKKIKLIIPSGLEEQQEIVSHLDQKCSAIDDLIAKKEQYLAEIENYKKSLIYEYVTGKKEVPQEYRMQTVKDINFPNSV